MAKSYNPDDLAKRTFFITIVGTAIYIGSVALFVY
jgi:hypothetical protein